MKCRYCGYEIPEGELYCRKCGEEVFIVPDYNPLDDMLTAQIKVGVNNEGGTEDLYAPISDGVAGMTSARRRAGTSRNAPARRNTGARRGTRTQRPAGNVRNTGTGGTTGARRNTNAGRYGNTGRNPSGRELSEREMRRRQIERKRAAMKKKRRRVLIVCLVLAALSSAGCIVLYQNSYDGIVNKGYRAIKNQQYTNAESCFHQAIGKNKKKSEAYTGLSQVYLRQNNVEEAVEMFDDVIKEQPENADVYESYLEFCVNNDRKMLIPYILDDARDSIRKKLSDYIVAEPEFNLEDEEVYDDVQQLEITAGDNSIQYTTDRSDPLSSGIKYDGPIHLEEGDNVICAAAFDERGIPSMPVEKTYVVELPIVDAPAVSPSTGQYESAQQIEIKVPDGYEAFYTLTGEDPTTASTKYTEPVDMPGGETLFKAILVDGGGRVSGVTTRNYMLEE